MAETPRPSPVCNPGPLKPATPKNDARSNSSSRLEGVNKTFDGFKAINDLNFYMDEGELRVIIGPNGAGKSTMLDIITGRTRPDKGKVEFGRDTDLTKLNEYQINRLGIGRKFQTPSVYIDHTVFENIWLSLEGTRTRLEHACSPGSIPRSAIASMKC